MPPSWGTTGRGRSRCRLREAIRRECREGPRPSRQEVVLSGRHPGEQHETADHSCEEEPPGPSGHRAGHASQPGPPAWDDCTSGTAEHDRRYYDHRPASHVVRVGLGGRLQPRTRRRAPGVRWTTTAASGTHASACHDGTAASRRGGTLRAAPVSAAAPGAEARGSSTSLPRRPDGRRAHHDEGEQERVGEKQATAEAGGRRRRRPGSECQQLTRAGAPSGASAIIRCEREPRQRAGEPRS